jgi:hypothetical protein
MDELMHKLLQPGFAEHRNIGEGRHRLQDGSFPVSDDRGVRGRAQKAAHIIGDLETRSGIVQSVYDQATVLRKQCE